MVVCLLFMIEVDYCELKNGLKIAYHALGDKKNPTLLFVHGLASYKGVWYANAQELQQHFHCILLDLPGSGESSRGEYPYHLDFFSNTLVQFIKELKLREVTWVGHSMGGQICLHAALHYHMYVKHMILFSPAGFEYYLPNEASLFKSAIILGDFMNMDELHISNAINSSFYQSSAFSKTMIEHLHGYIRNNDRRLYRLMMERCMNAMLDEQLFPKLRNIPHETLVFFGENDMLIPNRYLHPVSTLEIAERAVNEMPEAMLKTYTQCGHYVMVEKAPEVNREIKRWLLNLTSH